MLDILKNTFEALFLSVIAASIFAPMMISMLYKMNQVAEHKKSKLGGGVKEGETNEVFLKIMNVSGQNGTPNIGGILVWVVVPIMTILLVQRTESVNTFLLGFLLLGAWGFIDVVVTNRMKKDEKFRMLQERFWMRVIRFSVSALINLLLIWVLYANGVIDQLSLGSVAIAFTPIIIPILALVAHFAVYSAEIIDGLDALMIGIFGIVYTGLGAMLLIQGQYEYLPIIGIIIGVIFVDLYFNIPPARFFNGGPGAMTLGFGAFYIGLVSDNLIPYMFMSGWTWFVMSTSMIQIISMRFRKKRIFKIAPIHHHFQAIGWPSYKVTMRFWLMTMFLTTLGIYISLFI